MSSLDFGKKRFGATVRDWNDWRWQVRHAFRTRADLECLFPLSPEEAAAFDGRPLRLPVAITPYYASLLNPASPLRRIVVPTAAETRRGAGEYDDPLGEEKHRPVPCLVHTYPDRALFLVTGVCPAYCRYCTRARLAGRGAGLSSRANWRRALSYLREHAEIRDVVISGGEPLLLPDEKLEWLLWELRHIPHLELLRISTRVPAVLPQRVTPALARLFGKCQPLWVSVHFAHPDELTPEAARACARLAEAGVPMGSQTVLLRGINDSPDTIRRLMRGLLRMRVKPYYLHQCDAVVGSAAFRASVQDGINILRALHGHTSGYAVPLYMIDAPGGGGKVPLSPDYILGRKNGTLLLENYRGQRFRYRLADGDPFARGRRRKGPGAGLLA
ncbi:MAG TPA: KamA family radical SAM protein [Kiritimatiellia bacterium]|nr:KamA family radical SAM protein [Kiritimatiellia bacterium]HRZ11773.1 KamA family radical SAM protein [Kiritimatiellia bacterium]HSA17420.1 KamA family radical SAM protein [Kiritimatiellia bacterium]